MKLRSSLMIAFAATALLTGTAFAHDQVLHSKEDEAKAKPATCQQLNDPEHYEIDLKDDSTRSLKARCDARKKAQEQTAAPAQKKPATTPAPAPRQSSDGKS